MSGPLVDPLELPEWLRPLVAATADLDPATFRRLSAPGENGRDAAVLVLLGEHATRGPDVLLQLRASGNGAHSGQVAFPGGSAEPGDVGPVDTALREAVEETGLDPAGVRPVALLPRLHIPVSGFHVTPVVAHWERPSKVWAVDPAESAAVARAPLAELADPANRFNLRHPSGFLGPAFALPGMLVWGFTAGVLNLVLDLGGFARPWDATDIRDLDTAWRSVGSVGGEVDG
ncbi:NUDIX hydrolase [Actinophytocola xanthii]|uniref:Coenzyme A pyrophosphatase n=1 Tax=Actinophytocola xanthii TaxID=1912961 RepID=A0A1Q8CN91_9PSEU|nr:CoA pyrophosphatase [Actinophytocola xanthii]OLF15831.1 coenzyme A pyrophosphatase [Actinophytocola xanthii]